MGIAAKIKDSLIMYNVWSLQGGLRKRRTHDEADS